MKLVQRFAIAYIRTKFKLLAALSRKKAARQAFDLFCTPQVRNLRTPAPVFSEAELLQFDFLDYTVRGYRWNEGGSRKALILHGFESSVVNFATYVQPLVAKGYEVLAFDAPAHGRSTGSQLNAVIYRDFIKYIHERFGPVRSYIAHSFGGLALALALAEMQHDETYRVALIAPAAEIATAIDHFFTFIRLNDPGVRREFEKIILAIGGHGVPWFSLARALPEVKARILWVNDEDDKITPVRDALPVKAKQYLNIEFIFTRGLGHRRIYRNPEVGKTIVGFI